MKKCPLLVIPKNGLALMLFLNLVITCIQGQNKAGLDTIKISGVQLSKSIGKFSLIYSDARHTIKPAQFRGLFRDTIPASYFRKISPTLVQEDIYLKFIVQNTADTAISYFFLPGFYFQQIDLFTLDSLGMVENLPHLSEEPLGYRKIKIPGNHVSVLFARLKFVKTTVNILNPAVIRDYYLTTFITASQNTAKESNTITFIISGVMLMMIFYSLAVFYLNENIEFLYYSGYAFSLGVMLFLKSYLFRSPSAFNYFFEAYFDFIIQSAGTFVYVAFLKKFIDTKTYFPRLHKLIVTEQVLTVISAILFSYLYYFTDRYVARDWVENLTKYMWALSMIIFLISTFNKKNSLLSYLSKGIFCLLTGSLASLYFIHNANNFASSIPRVFTNALVYYELGIVSDLAFFLIALAFKNKNDIVNRTKESERLKLENERQEFEKQVAVLSAKQEERNRISADMHDELGSGVTAIRLMSEIVKSKMKEQTLPEINKISNSANDLINKMNTLIWTMKSEHDSLESLIAYIRAYALEFFENTAMECVVTIPDGIPSIELSGVKRRNLFLSVKESLNNILKHSKAGQVTITYLIDKKLIIFITDNGVGIDLLKLRIFGNGLGNIKKRMEGIDGIYRIENNNGTGTKTTLELVL